jgi:hypothetical protein
MRGVKNHEIITNIIQFPEFFSVLITGFKKGIQFWIANQFAIILIFFIMWQSFDKFHKLWTYCEMDIEMREDFLFVVKRINANSMIHLNLGSMEYGRRQIGTIDICSDKKIKTYERGKSTWNNSVWGQKIPQEFFQGYISIQDCKEYLDFWIL